jgi:mRNA interferase RelE/StbE
MKYRIRYAAAVVRQLQKMSPDLRRRIQSKINRLADDLAGDVKRLTNFSPEYRLRVGDWRVLFNIHGDIISIEHVSHRSQAY